MKVGYLDKSVQWTYSLQAPFSLFLTMTLLKEATKPGKTEQSLVCQSQRIAPSIISAKSPRSSIVAPHRGW